MVIIFLTKLSFSIEFKVSWFSKMDCKSCYWQVKMDEESIHLTAFSASQGYYEWIVMSFGLQNTPQIFQRRMDNMFKDLYHCCLVYIDDNPYLFKDHRTI